MRDCVFAGDDAPIDKAQRGMGSEYSQPSQIREQTSHCDSTRTKPMLKDKDNCISGHLKRDLTIIADHTTRLRNVNFYRSSTIDNTNLKRDSIRS